SNGATITLSDDAVTLNNKPLKGVATGTDATDAVNKGQLDRAIEKITGNDGALSNTITLGGNNGSFTSNQTLNQKDGIKLIIKGVDESSNENGKIVAPEWADFDTNNVMTKADGDTLRIAISKMPTFKTVSTDMIIAKEGNFSDKIVIGNITIQNKGGQLTWDGNNTLFYVEDKDGNKRAIGLNDSVRFNEYLKVVDDEKNISGNGGTGSDNSGVNGSSGALDKNTTPTVNVDVDKLINEKDLANKTYINNKLSELKTTIISEVSPNGTIGTGTNTDMKAVSGQTVEEYLEKNYTNNRELNRYLTELSHQANAGTASALASAGMPQISSLENGNIMISAGVGSYGGESAAALGISGINNNRDITYKVATTYDSTGRWGLSGGIGFAIGAGSNRSLNNVNSKELANRLNSLEKANKSLSETNSKLQEEVENLKAMLQQLLQK
ncbi:YadA-like family protein, partial [Veillonella magna]